MRVRIKSEDFPSKSAWLEAFSTSMYRHGIASVLDIMYNCLYTNANTIGFECVRYNFSECIIILQNQDPFGWVLEINIKP